ncbi:MAG: TRAM domain-containing protein, partial [Chloroflexota bacterium]|nr:TRAM domain-containing protein [Chloroflexota bacterium]
DYADVRGVDSKLIRLARQRRAAIVTTDSNLDRVAGLQGIAVLNVHELGNALRAVVVTGEELSLEIAQPGRERGQGIGFLEDGTMVIVEGGRRLLGGRAEVEVTRVLPTAGGRIVFSRLRQGLAEQGLGEQGLSEQRLSEQELQEEQGGPEVEGRRGQGPGVPTLRVVPARAEPEGR